MVLRKIIELNDLNITSGVSILHSTYGKSNSDNRVSNIGDVNGDSYDDFIIGAPFTEDGYNNVSKSYVIFGKANGYVNLDLTNFSNSQGFIISSINDEIIIKDNDDDYNEDDGTIGFLGGHSVSGRGDINQDGYDDIIIGIPNVNLKAGISYLLFGRGSNFTNVDLHNLSIDQGFSIFGSKPNDFSGDSVNIFGDFNGDGYDDIVIGAPSRYLDNRNMTSYVIFGKESNFTNIYLSNLTLNQGFYISRVGGVGVVSGAGDINKDGYNDIIIGIPYADYEERNNCGVSYIIYGKPSNFTNIDLLSLNPSLGLTLLGAKSSDNFGYSVSGAKDVNGDGYGDIIIGANEASICNNCYGNNEFHVGITYIIFGGSAMNATLDMLYLNNSQGFSVQGINNFDEIGTSVSSAGDINNDGYDDIIIGSYRGGEDKSIAYVIYGHNGSFNNIELSMLTEDRGLRIIGTNGIDFASVSSAGDINNDGYDDILIGVPNYEGEYNAEFDRASISYLIFGTPNGENINPTTDSPTLALSIPPSVVPTFVPVAMPTSMPSIEPTVIPSKFPTRVPTTVPSNNPSVGSTTMPSIEPTVIPSEFPTSTPSFKSSTISSEQPTVKPSLISTVSPSLNSTTLPIISSTVSPTCFDKSTGFNIYGASITSVSCAGDINGDGYIDVIIGAQYDAPNGRINAGTSYVIFGKENQCSDIDLRTLTLTEGIKIWGANSGDFSGFSVSDAGDINGDGFDDIIVGAPYANLYGRVAAGASYVIFGKPNFADVDLATLSQVDGFQISGTYSGSYSNIGCSVSSAGDINGDGYKDIIIGARGAGTSYVIFGTANSFDNIDLYNLDISHGFKIWGEFSYGYTGFSVSSAGDVNNDGYDDIIIGAMAADSNSKDRSGASYVIFGQQGNFYDISLASLNNNQGFRIFGAETGDNTGWSVSNAGDFNGDGLDDVIVGAPGTEFNSKNSEGSSYVIFGESSGFNDIDLSTLNNIQGFKISGDITDKYSGYSVSNAGDFNCDGFGDVIIGSHRANTYIIFGKSDDFGNIDLANLNDGQGIELIYRALSVSTIGDINNDGCDDVIVGRGAGASVLYGKSDLSTIPTSVPSNNPSSFPTYTSTENPSSAPSGQPTALPSAIPVIIPISHKNYAVFSREVYADPDHTPVLEEANDNGSRIPTGWQVLVDSESAGISPSLGEKISGWNFFSKAYRNSDYTAVIIAFQGTESLYDILSEDLDLARGLMPSYYNLLIQFVDYVIDNFNINKNMISFTGHSLGGFLAQLATATYNKPSVVFESPGAKRVIDNYYNHLDYSIKYNSEDIKDIIESYNAAPNLINIASGAHFEDTVIRLFPVYDTSASTFTLQQHGMSEILQQFSNDGAPKISANMDNYWHFSGSYKNWPYFEANSLSDSVAANSFLNSVFFKNYNQNPYYWELAWDTSPNIDSVLFPSTAKRIVSINNAMGGIASGNALSAQGITISGDDNGNKFFGGTNYADSMIAGTGNDEYWPFSGMNQITDTGGSNNYYFYTHNMKGTTVISDTDKTGEIQFVNIGCSIAETYQIDFGTNIGNYVFFPQLSPETISSSLCDLNKYSSGIRDKLDPSVNQYINHKNDVVLLYSDYPNNADLLISYNNNDRDNSQNNKIVIKNFQEGDFVINFGNDDDQETYVAVGSNGNDLFSCSTEQNSILAGLGGINKYIIPLLNDKSCSIISNDMDSNIYKIFADETSRFLNSDYSKTEAVDAGVVNTFGLKNTDVIDLSSVGLNSFTDLSFSFFGNDTIITLPGGMTMRLDTTQTFVATMDGTDLALYNSPNNSYTTDFIGSGINISLIYNALNTIFPGELPTGTPTILPTLDQNSRNQHNENDDITINDGIIAGIVAGGAALLGMAYTIYAFLKPAWPFIKHMENIRSNPIKSEEMIIGDTGYELVVKHDDIEIAGAGSVNEETL